MLPTPKQIKNKILIIAATTLCITFSGQYHANAGVEHLNLPTCKVGIFPYNPQTVEITGNTGTSLINFLEENICKSRTPYGQSYNQPPTRQDNPLLNTQDISQKNVPYAVHTHGYVNTSLEDNFYYFSYVDKFEIKLQADALNNIDKYNIQCTTPAPGSYNGDAHELSSCNGEIRDTGFYGGVKISYDSSTGKILWEFGTVNKDFRPRIWGNNDNSPSDSDNFNEVLENVFKAKANLSDPNSIYRHFTPYITIKTRNNPEEIWSATTTSKILIRNYAILKDNFNKFSNNNSKFSNICSSLGDYTKWCPEPTPTGQNFATEKLGTNKNQEWFWFPIGSVVSVWEKPAKPPTKSCKTLNLTVTPSTISQGDTATITTNPLYDDGTTNDPVEYSESGTGYFKSTSAGCPTPSDHFTAPHTCSYSYVAPTDGSTTSFTIKAQNDSGNPDCSKTFLIPPKTPPPPSCSSLTLKVDGTPNQSPIITAYARQALSAMATDSNGQTMSMLEWSVTGKGSLVSDPQNDPAICPPITINSSNSPRQALYVCNFFYIAPPIPDQSDSYSVSAFPPRIGDSPSCKIQATAKNFPPPPPPPPHPPFCTSLDLPATINYDPSGSILSAKVTMSDGSHYSGQVRFVSTDGSGRFSGGTGNNSPGNPFLTSVDAQNNTGNVTFTGGNPDTKVNIFLSNTTIQASDACMKQLSKGGGGGGGCTTPGGCDGCIGLNCGECVGPTCINGGLCPGKRFPQINIQGDQYCVYDLTKGKFKDFCWTITTGGPNQTRNPLLPPVGSNTKTSRGLCITIPTDRTNFRVHVETCPDSGYDPLICYDDYSKTETKTFSDTPTLTKQISKDGQNFGTKVNFSTNKSQPKQITYHLNFTPANAKADKYLSATISDPAFSGTITGTKYKYNDDPSRKETGGTISINTSQISIKQGNNNIPVCTSSSTPISNCYTLNQSSSLATITGIISPEKITISYSGTLTPGLTEENCQSGSYCNESFQNTANVKKMQYCTQEPGIPTEEDPEPLPIYPCTDIPIFPAITSNPTTAEIVCPYFLTRASGEIFLEETDLKLGIDVSKCYPFKNISSLIIRSNPPTPGSLAKTGAGANFVNINHEICSAGQSDFKNFPAPERNALEPLYGSKISSLSSQICEVSINPGEDWNKDNIRALINKNVDKLTRWNAPTLISTISTFDELKNNSPGKVYYYNGNNLGTPLTINKLELPEGSGAYTIIVENADLIIRGNITYTPGGTVNTASDITSLGIIVKNGNLFVSPDVTSLAGAFFIEKPPEINIADLSPISSPFGKTNIRKNLASPTTGNIYSGTDSSHKNLPSDNTLTIFGSLHGNIAPLFQNRNYTGDINQDEGAITIRYDQRMIQNPPPGMAEIFGDLSQNQVAQ